MSAAIVFQWIGFCILLAAVAWAPFPFGSSRPKWTFALEAAVALSAIAYAVSILTSRSKEADNGADAEVEGRKPGMWGLLPKIGLGIAGIGLLLGLAQLIPLPEGALRVLSPQALELRKDSGAYAGDVVAPLSLRSYMSRWLWLRWIAYGAVFWLAGFMSRSRQRALWPVALSVIGLALAVLGMAQHLTKPYHIYWRYRYAQGVGAPSFGPFVNRNHYGGYVAAVMPFAFALGVHWSRRAAQDRRQRSAFCGYAVVAWLVLAVMFASQVICASRSGFAVSLFALAVMIVGWAFAMVRSRWKWIVPAGIVCGALLLPPLIGSELAMRLRQVPESLRGRTVIWREAGQVGARFLLSGCGNGAFKEAFDVFRSPALGSKGYLHPEQEYLQILCEMGIVGLVAFLLLAAVVFAFGIHRQAGMQPDMERWHLLACVAGLTALAVQGLAHANLRMPSHGYLAAVLAGNLLAVNRDELHLRGARKTIMGVLLLSGAVLYGLVCWGLYRGEAFLAAGNRLRAERKLPDQQEALFKKAVAVSPDNPEALLRLGDCSLLRHRRALKRSRTNIELDTRFEHYYRAAIRAQPTWPEPFVRLAAIASEQGPEASDRAERFLKKAQELAPNDPHYAYVLGDFYCTEDRRNDAIDAYAESLRIAPDYKKQVLRKGILLCSDLKDWHRLVPEEYRKGGELALHLKSEHLFSLAREEMRVASKRMEESGLPPSATLAGAVAELLATDQAVEMLSSWSKRWPGLPDVTIPLARLLRDEKRYEESISALLEALPLSKGTAQRLPILLRLGEVSALSGNIEDADRYFAKAVNAFPRHPSSWMYRGEFLRQQERFKEACGCFVQAQQRFPERIEPYLAIAAVYEQQGDVPSAIEWIREGLRTKPRNPELKKRLEQLLKSAPETGP